MRLTQPHHSAAVSFELLHQSISKPSAHAANAGYAVRSVLADEERHNAAARRYGHDVRAAYGVLDVQASIPILSFDLLDAEQRCVGC